MMSNRQKQNAADLIVSVESSKGGVGKTTASLCLSRQHSAGPCAPTRPCSSAGLLADPTVTSSRGAWTVIALPGSEERNIDAGPVSRQRRTQPRFL